jgi:hypothetical protein
MRVGMNISELSNLRQVVWALMLGFLFFGPKAQAQNLVKNPSFEETNNWMSGNKLQKIRDNKEVLINDKLYFLNEDEAIVEIIGKNSTYIFYLEPGNPAVKVSPTSGVILKIEEIRDWQTPLKG